MNKAASIIAATIEKGTKLFPVEMEDQCVMLCISQKSFAAISERKDKPTLLGISCDASALTCIGNDFGFEKAFSRQVEALGKENDVLFVIFTSGNGPNILKGRG